MEDTRRFQSMFSISGYLARHGLDLSLGLGEKNISLFKKAEHYCKVAGQGFVSPSILGGKDRSSVLLQKFRRAYWNYKDDKIFYGGTPPAAVIENVTKLAKQVLDLHELEWKETSYARDPSFALEQAAEDAMEFFLDQTEKGSKLYAGDPSNIREYVSYAKNWKCSHPSTKHVPSRCPSNVSSSKATRADTRIDIPDEGDALQMSNVRSRASNSAPASSSGHSVFAQDGSSTSSTMPQDTRIPNGVHNHGNDWSRASNSASASSSSHSVFAQDRSSPSFTIQQDMPSGQHFEQPETSNARATTSHIFDVASASEASNEANARSEIRDDSDSEAPNGQANAGSEIHDRVIDIDHSARIERRDIRAPETKFLFELNALIASITGPAVLSLATSTSTDSPFLRWCAATAGIGFLGSVFAIGLARNQRVAKVLSKIGAMGAVSAVSIALGFTVLKDTEWYRSHVATGIACLLSNGAIAMAQI